MNATYHQSLYIGPERLNWRSTPSTKSSQNHGMERCWVSITHLLAVFLLPRMLSSPKTKNFWFPSLLSKCSHPSSPVQTFKKTFLISPVVTNFFLSAPIAFWTSLNTYGCLHSIIILLLLYSFVSLSLNSYTTETTTNNSSVICLVLGMQQNIKAKLNRTI